MDEKVTEAIRKYALGNAIKFEGKANPGAVIGKIMAEFPDAKKDMKALSSKINEIIKDINSMDVETQTDLLRELAPEMLEKKEKEEKGLPELKNAVSGKVVTRMPPEPSKYNHIGHAISFLINYMYAKKYDGRCIMRFDDTNPEKESQEYVDAMEEDVYNYLGIKPDKAIFASDHMDRYYEYAEKLINEGNAYVCFCPQEEIGKGRREMTECEHRKKSVDEEKKAWAAMKGGKFEERECVLRLKIDMAHKNAVMRDPVIYRLCYTPHYRQKDKYKVWPMYDFESAIEEGLNGVTHVLRSNEFDSRTELQNHIAKLFGFPDVEYRHYGRFNITGATTKGREIREMIESGKYIGWDDPRLVTLRALRRRGITKEAIYELTKSAGLSKQNTNIDYTVIAALNRGIVDQASERYFFIDDHEHIRIKGAPERKIKLNKHPDKKDHSRKFDVGADFYVSKRDLSDMKDGELYRLMDCLNFRKADGHYTYVSDDVETYRKEGKKIIHWLPFREKMHCEIMMPDASILKGYCEVNAEDIKEGDIVQFERFGFCRLDKKGKEKLRFWFGHK